MPTEVSYFDSAANATTTAWQWLEPWLYWETLKSFGNSTFTTSLVGALAGAYFGARSAQRVAERSKVRDDLVKEIRNVNAATALSFGIVNGMLELKKQHVAQLKSSHNHDLQRHQEYMAKRESGEIQGNAPYALKIDFRKLPMVNQPISLLRDIVFGRLSTSGRALNLVASLEGALDSLNTSIAQRNHLIKMFEAGEFPPGADLPAMYLSLPYNGGHVNQQYADIVGATASYTDDAIFFSCLLCKDIQEYGNGVAATFRTSLKKTPPRVFEVDFKQAEEGGLLPKDDEYKTWFTAFQKLPTPKRRWWQRAA